MKKFIKAIQIFALLATVSFDAGGTSKGEYYKACDSTGQLAESIMTARQSGVPLNKAMEQVIKIYPKADQLLLDAYKQPIWNIKKNQDRAIADFKNNTLIICYGSIDLIRK